MFNDTTRFITNALDYQNLKFLKLSSIFATYKIYYKCHEQAPAQGKIGKKWWIDTGFLDSKC